MVVKQKSGTVKLPLEEYHKLHEFYEKMHQPEMVCRISSYQVNVSYSQHGVSFISLTEAQDEIIKLNRNLSERLSEANTLLLKERTMSIANALKYNKLMTNATEMLSDLIKLKISSIWGFRKWRKNNIVDEDQLKSIESSSGPY